MNRRAALVGGLGLLLLAVVWWIAVAGPQRSELDDARADLAAAEADQAVLAAQGTVAAGGDLASEAELEAELAALVEAVPAAVDLAGLLRTTGERAAADGVALVAVVPGDVETSVDPATPGSVPVQIQLQGPLDGVVRFLADIRSDPRVVVVERVLVTPVDPTTADPTLDVTIGLRAFVATAGDPAAVVGGATGGELEAGDGDLAIGDG